MADLEEYRKSPSEIVRTQDLLRLLPAHSKRALDVGARDGHFSRLLAERCDEVVALDLEMPSIQHPRVTCAAGDLCNLSYPDGFFDLVFCAEVLEHIPDLEAACRTLVRISSGTIIIGVPFRQDTRSGRTRCLHCGRRNPPYGHVNTFDEKRLRKLFPLPVVEECLIGETQDATNWFSTTLMDLAGNPWGTYTQDETCTHCGKPLVHPPPMSLAQRVCAGIASRVEKLQHRWTPHHATWIHMVFRKL